MKMKSTKIIAAAFTFISVIAFSPLSHADDTPWTQSEVLQPESLAKTLKDEPKDKQPLLVHVGFDFLYKNGHIPGSVYAGPAKDKAGIQKLREALAKLPKDRSIVIYCGCCPLKKCPNVRPAFKLAKELGFKNVKLLFLNEDFQTDWADKGFPVEKTATASR